MREGELTALCLAAGGVGLVLTLLGAGPGLVLVGCLAGALTGLVPGLHVNTLLPLLGGGAYSLVLGAAISHSFFDFAPAIMLGAPDESSALSVLPSHKMLLRGRALEAFRTTIAAGLLSGLLAIAMLPLAGFAGRLPWLVPMVVALATLLLLWQPGRMVQASIVMAASALLGLATFGTDYGVGAMLSGFFGTSSIIHSLRGRCGIPPQLPEGEAHVTLRSALLGAVAGIFAGLFPAVSSSVAATAACPRMGHRSFLAVLGGTGTAYAIVAVLAMHIVGRPHSGAGIAIAAESPPLLMLVGLSLIALSFSAWLAWSLSRAIVLSFRSLDYRLASLAALCLIVLFNAANGISALIVMSVATAIGLACLHTGARRSSCMASLLIPTLLYSLL